MGLCYIQIADFHDVRAGLPALFEHLCGRGCLDVRFAFVAFDPAEQEEQVE